jgi:hypothetical protein
MEKLMQTILLGERCDSSWTLANQRAQLAKDAITKGRQKSHASAFILLAPSLNDNGLNDKHSGGRVAFCGEVWKVVRSRGLPGDAGLRVTLAAACICDHSRVPSADLSQRGLLTILGAVPGARDMFERKR